jgi:SAM-dependent MidA family methyltransferase
MELALYSPLGGYYRSHTPIGPAGDYFTSPTAHPLFGVLLAAQLQQMWELLGKPSPFTVIEAGAGNGILSRDITSAIQTTNPGFARALQYVALDYSALGNLQPGSPNSPRIDRISAPGIPLRGLVGCILTNELLDALPVHRFRVQDGTIFEVFVDVSGEKFVEVLQEPTSPLIAKRVMAATDGAVPEGYKGEVCLRADSWLTEASAALARGFVLTVDYGGTAKELYSPQRTGGTLRCHYQHVVSANPYVRVGRQDITAHVDFSGLKESGERCDLEVLGYTTQREFLYNLGAGSYLEALAKNSRPQPSYETGAIPRQEYLANRMGMQELLQLEGLGNFKVLVQGKGILADDLWGFTPDNPHQVQLQRDLDTLHVPLLTPTHTPLMEGKYPHQDNVLDLNSLTD